VLTLSNLLEWSFALSSPAFLFLGAVYLYGCKRG
jgi:hypothetical protein